MSQSGLYLGGSMCCAAENWAVVYQSDFKREETEGINLLHKG